MAYNKTNWQNAPSTDTPINASNLNKIEEGIYQNSLKADQIGDLSNLKTADKTSIVNSINELCIETGTENGWEWEKYSNGKAICFGSFTKNVAVTSQWGSLYTGIFGSIDFPTNLFIEIPKTFDKVVDGFSCWLIQSGTQITKDSTENIACVRPTSLSSSSVTISYLAIGQWK